MTYNNDDDEAFRRAGELADMPGALAVLLELHAGSGTATLGHLQDTNTRTSRRNVTRAVRWLAAEGLLCRADDTGSWDLDDPTTTYRLTDLSQRIIDSLAAVVAHFPPASPGSPTRRGGPSTQG